MAILPSSAHELSCASNRHTKDTLSVHFVYIWICICTHKGVFGSKHTRIGIQKFKALKMYVVYVQRERERGSERERERERVPAWLKYPAVPGKVLVVTSCWAVGLITLIIASASSLCTLHPGLQTLMRQKLKLLQGPE